MAESVYHGYSVNEKGGGRMDARDGKTEYGRES